MKFEDSNLRSIVPYIATFSLSSVGGFILGGIPGSIIGLSASLVDEYIISSGVGEKHFLSLSAYWSIAVTLPAAKTLSKIFSSYTLQIYGIAGVLVSIVPMISNDFFDFKNKISVPLDSFLLINRFFDDKNIISPNEVNRLKKAFSEDKSEFVNIVVTDAVEIYNNKFLSNFIFSNLLEFARIANTNIFYKLLGIYSQGIFINHYLNEFQGITIQKGLKMVGFLATKNFIDFLIDTKQQLLFRDQFKLVVEKSIQVIVENGRDILATDQGKQIVNNLTYDLYKLIFLGSNALKTVFSETTDALFSLSNIVKLAPDALLPYSVTVLPMQYFLQSMAVESKNLLEKLSELRTKAWEVKGDIFDNIEQIVLRDGEQFAKSRYNAILSEEKNIESKTEYNDKLKLGAYNVVETVNNLIDIAYFEKKSLGADPMIPVGKIPLVKTSLDTINSYVSSNINSNLKNKEVLISKDRIDKLFSIIDKSKFKDLVRVENAEGKIIFCDYILKLPNKYVNITSMEFLGGKHYAITGESGCGKTTTLIDMKKGVSGSLSSSGTISISSDSKIMFIDQKLYLPKGSTLLESVYFPSNLAELSEEDIVKLKTVVLDLFDELEIDRSSYNHEYGLKSKLDSKDFKLSGGQTKKVGIVQAIINKPTILIMDETFTGLDKNSVIKVQKILNKYLPNTMILSVDHHAFDNNYNDFYDFEVKFANNTAIIKKMRLKIEDVAMLSSSEEILSGQNTLYINDDL